MRRDPADVLQELATEVFGRGAAVSDDKERDGWVARAWDAKGACRVEAKGASKTMAQRALRLVLQRARVSA